jgi:hypothetical protein
LSLDFLCSHPYLVELICWIHSFVSNVATKVFVWILRAFWTKFQITSKTIFFIFLITKIWLWAGSMNTTANLIHIVNILMILFYWKLWNGLIIFYFSVRLVA